LSSGSGKVRPAWCSTPRSSVCEHGFTGHDSSVRRLFAQIGREQFSENMVRLTFAPGEAVQVGFRAGTHIIDPATSERRRTWLFVMTFCFYPHQYVEFV